MGAGSAEKMVQDGCKHPVDVVLDMPVADFAESVTKAVYVYNGLDPSIIKVVRIPLTAQDYSAQVAEATERHRLHRRRHLRLQLGGVAAGDGRGRRQRSGSTACRATSTARSPSSSPS